MNVKLLIGDDWSQDHHNICFMHPHTGAEILSFEVPQRPEGFTRIDTEREKLGIGAEECLVAIETAHNLIVDHYLAHQYPVYIIAPSVVKSSRGRWGPSGAYTDETSARLLADMLRTDRPRFTPWRPLTPLLCQMQAKLRLIEALRRDINRWSNRLRAHLYRFYPQPIGLFHDLEADISLQFLMRYPSPYALRQLTAKELRTFCREQHYTHPHRVPALYAHLQAPAPLAAPTCVMAYADEVRFLAQTLLVLVQQRRQLMREVKELFPMHPDHLLFASLPGSGDLLGPGLLVKFGDDRERFPTAQAVQALAGTCPVTQRSGKRKVILFRKACDKEFRRIAQQFALASLSEAAWAAMYLEELHRRGIVGSHAIRCVANRWLAIIWKIWQTHTTYDEEYHLQQRYQRRRPHR